MSIFVTGVAGFVGMHVAQRLLERGENVVGIDNLNDYYDVRLKHARLRQLEHPNFRFVRGDIANAELVEGLVADGDVDRVVHLAAQAGVRYSISNPFAYERSNLAGHLSVLEACRRAPCLKHLVYASSSSVYGDRPLGDQGFSESDPVDRPVSLYAATKRACELLSQSYAQLYSIPQSGLRFFTVYGPWGRPDMAYFSFTEAMLRDEPIEVYGEGRMARDFTYIDDIVDGLLGVLDRPPVGSENWIYNIGDSRPVPLMSMIAALESALGREAKKIMRPMQPGDVTATFADISKLRALTGYEPKINIEAGLEKFVAWRRANDWLAPAAKLAG